MSKKIERTSKGLASALFDEMDSLIAGDSTPTQAKAKVGIANSIVSISRLEMDYARFVATPRSELDSNELTALPMGRK